MRGIRNIPISPNETRQQTNQTMTSPDINLFIYLFNLNRFSILNEHINFSITCPTNFSGIDSVRCASNCHGWK
jgi:hypothetical protein